MLSKPLVDEIARLLAEGQLSQRKIAARLRVSRGTVGQIANQRRGLHGREPQPDDHDLAIREAPPERCGTCGELVYLPCVACRARAYVRRRRHLHDLVTAETHANHSSADASRVA